jgi:pyruvate formate lyase activating enzyme
METACSVSWRFVEQVLPHVDTMLHDLKMTIPERHKKWVGVDNKRILEDFKKDCESFPDTEFIARSPLIPGINADEEHIRAVLAFNRPHRNVIDYELFPYHRFGLGKYEFLGWVYELNDGANMDPQLIENLGERMKLIERLRHPGGTSAAAGRLHQQRRRPRNESNYS